VLDGLACAGGFIVAALITIHFFVPKWWSVPVLLLSSVGQQVPRPSAPIEPALTRVPPTGASTPAPTPTTTAATSVRVVESTPTPESSDLFGSIAGGVVLPQRRFNILLLGSDNDKKFVADAVLTQSIILVSVDPTSPDVAMVSIPRDSWVPIPTYGRQKIDVAYEVGGIALARTTVENLFGIHVDYYAWVGLDGLVKVIDSLGGVDVTVLHPILDETYPDDLAGSNPYAFFRLYIPAGPQHLDGTTALQYVRSRHGDLQSDFGRSARQQQVLLALKDRAADPSTIERIPALAGALSGAVKTDLTLPQVIQLANMARGISSGRIHQQVLSAPQFASLGWSPDHEEQMVIPNWRTIRPEIARLLHSHPDGVSEATADRARQEKATIGVLNGSGEAGLPSQVENYLAWLGLTVDSAGNARRYDYAHSQILVRDNDKSATVQLLATAFHASVVAQPDPTLATDVVLIIGRDHPAIPSIGVAGEAASV
jgi:LCP family protein required for cell wall assembly